MSFTADQLRDLAAKSFPATLGIVVDEMTSTRVVGRLPWRVDLTGDGRILHGGVLMSFADALGAFGAALNLKEGWITATLESKTNFCRAVSDGEVVGESLPLHIGRNAMVWQTSLRQGSTLISQTTQTQILIDRTGG